MPQRSLCTAHLFVASEAEHELSDALEEMAKKFSIVSQGYVSRRLRLDIEDASIEDIREHLLSRLTKLLDPTKRSCLSFFGRGSLNTIVIKDGKVANA